VDRKIYENIDQRFAKYYKWVEENKAELLSQSELQKYQYDWPRFAISIGLMEEYYGNKNIKVLELGGAGVSIKFLKAKFSNWVIDNYCNDLRKKDWDIKDDSYDLVISMEVVEHLSDVNQENFEWNASFQYSGLTNCLQESNRVLKNTGRMFLTTPNALSNIIFYKMIIEDIPHQYVPHVREYTYEELLGIIEGMKIPVINYECIEALCICWDFSYITDFIKKSKGTMKNRGSTLFFNLGTNKKAQLIRRFLL